MNIPKRTEALTPGWLTETLRSTGTITNAVVESIEIIERESDEHGRTKGVMGVSHQIRLTYDRVEANAPQSLYVKCSTDLDTQARAWAYQNEVRFYQDLASRSKIRTPRCYYADINPESGEHIVLLENVSPTKTNSYYTGYSLQEAEQAIRAIAKFQSLWWENPELAALDWLAEGDLQLTASDFQEFWNGFVQKMDQPLPESFKAIGANYGKNQVKAHNLHRNLPRTLVHGDYHIENLLFPEDGSPMVVVDWQFLMRGCGVWDVAYNLCFSLQAADRQAHEMTLLHLYHNILVESGVQGYSFEACFHDYRLSMLRPMHLFVTLIYYDVNEGEDRARFIDLGLPRFEAALTDLKVAELL